MNLITGGTGLVGAHILLGLLQKGEPVRALYRNKAGQEKTRKLFEQYKVSGLFEKIEWVFGDITDLPSLEEAFRDVKMVYHCAAMISFDPTDEEHLRKVNIEGTANMIHCALDFQVEKFCYVSSVAALGDVSVPGTVITEETEWNPEKPHSDYAISKYGAEMEVWRGFQEGLKGVIVNPGVIFGPGFWQQGSGTIINTVAKGNKYFTEGITGFISVEDVSRACIGLMDSPVNGERFCLVSECISFKELIFHIADGLNVSRPKRYARKWMTELAWRLDWTASVFFRQKRKFSKTTARSLHTKEYYSGEKIKKVLEFEYTPILPYLNSILKYYPDKF